MHLDLYPPVGHVCSVCASKTGLKYCTGCRVVQYCGVEHQRKHRKEHKVACNAISSSAKQLGETDPTLVSTYSQARYKFVESLLQVQTVDAIGMALQHCIMLLTLIPTDDLGVRDIVPNLLIRLDREQDCYDFIKWWSLSLSTKPAFSSKAGRFLSIERANALEPITELDLDSLSLCNLATLTLLKTRLRLDVLEQERDTSYMSFGGLSLDSNHPDPFARKIGDVVRELIDRRPFNAFEKYLANMLKTQCQTLCKKIQNNNPHFWDILASDSKMSPAKAARCLPGSEQEAIMASSHCKAAWNESDDALRMAQSITIEYAKLYTSPVEPTGLERKCGVGRVFAGLFESNQSPTSMFPPAQIAGSHEIRFVHVHDNKKILVFVDGACSNNGQSGARAGWAVVYGPQQPGKDQDQGFASGRLEAKGPFDDEFTATSNRAELRAVIAALRLCDWTDTKCTTLVLATDSTYVVDGMTKWARRWITQEWNLSGGGEVKNQDLWKLLLGEIERCDDLGFSVKLWRIPREENAAADEAAKNACGLPAKAEFSDTTIDAPRRAGEKPTFLGLSLQFSKPEQDFYLSLILAKRDMKMVTSEEAAVSILAQAKHPLVIIAADGELARHKVLAERVIDHVRRGATLVLTGTCMSYVTMDESARLFAMMGLPARFAEYTRYDIKLQKDAVGSRFLPNMDKEIYMKASYLRGMPKSTMWYVAESNPGLSPVVFSPLGKGNVGIIGDVTQDKTINLAFMAMCGLGGEVAGQ